MANVMIDWERCIHSGMCTTIAENVFEMNGDAKMVVRAEQVGGADLDTVLDAAACCPVDAILVDG
jgi:ferredoxin